MEIFCKACNHSNQPESLSCSNCGKRLLDENGTNQDTDAETTGAGPEAPTPKKRGSGPLLVGLLVAAIACGLGYLAEKSSLEHAGMPTGQHEYVFDGETTTKQVGTNKLRLFDIEESDSVFRPSFLVLRSIAPADIVSCPEDSNQKTVQRLILRKEAGNIRMVQVGSDCAWQEDSPEFEGQIKEIEEKVAHSQDPSDTGRFDESGKSLIQGADFGDSRAIIMYLADQSIASSFGQEGPASLDIDRDYTYWRALKSRESDFPSDSKMNFNKLSKIMGDVFLNAGVSVARRDGPGDFARAQVLFIQSAKMGSPDGMMHYLLSCTVNHFLTTNGSQTGFWPNRELADDFFNKLKAMEQASTLDPTELEHFRYVKAHWNSEEVFSDQPSTDTPDASVDITVVKTERQPITLSSWVPRVYVRNNSSQEVSNVRVPVQAFDENGVMVSEGDAHFSSIPPHTTATTTCVMPLLMGNPTLKVGDPTAY